MLCYVITIIYLKLIGNTYIVLGVGLFLNPFHICINQPNTPGSNHIYYTNERVTPGITFFHLSTHDTLRSNKVLTDHTLLLFVNNSSTKKNVLDLNCPPHSTVHLLCLCNTSWTKGSEITSTVQNNVSQLTENDLLQEWSNIPHRTITNLLVSMVRTVRQQTVVMEGNIRYWKYRKIPTFHRNPCKHHQ